MFGLEFGVFHGGGIVKSCRFPVRRTASGLPEENNEINPECSIWQPGPQWQERGVETRLGRFQVDHDRSQSGLETTVDGRVQHDADANFVFVRLAGRTTVVDLSGNAGVAW
jgi:hypothetical protein